MLASRCPCDSRPIAAGCETTANMPQPAASSRDRQRPARKNQRMRQFWRAWLPGPRHSFARGVAVWGSPGFRRDGEQLADVLADCHNLRAWARARGVDLDDHPNSLARLDCALERAPRTTAGSSKWTAACTLARPWSAIFLAPGGTYGLTGTPSLNLIRAATLTLWPSSTTSQTPGSHTSPRSTPTPPRISHWSRGLRDQGFYASRTDPDRRGCNHVRQLEASGSDSRSGAGLTPRAVSRGCTSSPSGRRPHAGRCR
jgi:Family of unknown function (DUF6278)